MSGTEPGSIQAPIDQLGAARPTERPVTARRFIGALVLACVLLLVVTVLFALTGLRVFGILPAFVVAMVLTVRIAGIRRWSVIIAIGVLSFLIVFGGSMALLVWALSGATGVPVG
jgi:hypothetical protein